MLNRIVDFSLQNKLLIIILFVLLIGLSLRTMFLTKIDAFPDTTPVQVQINTVAPSLNPTEIERQITLPIEVAITGLPGLINIRSISKFGLSQVVTTFNDKTDIYTARQLIFERLGNVELPQGIERPALGPISTGMGEVFHYILSSANPERTLEELRTIHDWIVKPELRKVAGVAEVNSWGGFEKQYHVVVKPELLIKYRLTFDNVFDALEKNNNNVGGGQIVSSGEALLVHGIGQVTNVEQIRNITIKAYEGVPVRVGDVAEVAIGHEIPRGAVTAQGKGEVVLGLGFMLMGENSKEVTERLKERLTQIRKSLPEDVILKTVYDRTELVKEVIATASGNLISGIIMVIIVLFLILGNVRASFLVAISIPISMLFAFLGMYKLSIAASLLSLGAIDFGIVIDGCIVMTEINMRRLAEKTKEMGRTLNAIERLQCVIESGRQVVRPIIFGMGIVIIVFLPILTLEGIEGKFFKPMAWTFIFAMSGALLTALFLSPILSYYFPPKKKPEKLSSGSFIERFLEAGYVFLLARALRARRLLLVMVGLLFAVSIFIGTRLGGEFIPKLNEGAIVINVIRLAGVSMDEVVTYNTRIENLLLENFPDEIRHIWSRVGTPEVATDPMGIELTDIFLTLEPREKWKRAKTQGQLIERIEEVIGDLPGLRMVFTQPIEMRMNEMIAGVRSDVALRIYGDDFDELVDLGNRVQTILQTIKGASEVSVEQITGQPLIQISVNQDQIARHGIPAKNVLDVIESVGNKQIGEIIEGQRRFPLTVHLPVGQRTDVEVLANTLIPTESGPLLPLRSLANVRETTAPSTINHEWGRRLIKVQCNVRDRDVLSFVKEAQSRIEKELKLPEGYLIEWGGQFENLERSKRRLMIVTPISLLIIFLLLYFSLKSFRDTLLVYTAIPFAAIGGIFSLYLRGIPFSVSAGVGFIALFGIAVLNGQIMISAIRLFSHEGLPLTEAIIAGAKQRLRPVLATAITDAIGFAPMAISTGIGSEVQRPLATVVVAGVFTSTILTLFILPLLYAVSRKYERNH